MNNKVALSMIVKGHGDEYKKLDRALSSMRPYVDDIFITFTGEKGQMDKSIKVASQNGAKISYHTPYWTATKEAIDWIEDAFGWTPHMKEGDKIFLFDEARNFNMAQIPKDYGWIFWMDSDDIVRGGENLKKIIEESNQTGMEAIYFKYLYQTEYKDIEVCQTCGKDLNVPQIHINHVIIEHIRERLIRNTGIYKWIAPIHETLIEQRPSRKTTAQGLDVVHLSPMSDRIASLTRNLNNLEYSVYKSEAKDPRHVYYLAKAFFDIGTREYDDKCIKLIWYYLISEHKSGWPAERAQAYNYLSEIYKRRDQVDVAIRCLLFSLSEYEEDSQTYLNMAICYTMKKEWERALFWVRLANSIPAKETTLVVNTKDIQARTLEVLYNCSLNLNKVDEAYAASTKLMEMYPNHDGVKNAFQFITNLRTQRELTKNVVQLADFLKQSGERSKIKALLAASPAMIEQNPFIINLFQQNNPPKTWENDEIAIYCGMGFTNWSPKIMDDPKGNFVGGSEEAVIKMAEALAKQNWKVTVYADPGNDEGVINGVTWLPYYKFNRADRFNILVAWRDIRFFDQKFSSAKNYLWCHDIQSPVEYTAERLDNINKIFFLSKWHRDNVPALSEDKVFMTSNGV